MERRSERSRSQIKHCSEWVLLWIRLRLVVESKTHPYLRRIQGARSLEDHRKTANNLQIGNRKDDNREDNNQEE